MTTLYRKYRPQNFQEVVGQNPIKITLENQVQTDSFAHAYLFCGPRAVGKTTLARVFTKAINCLNRKEGESAPCNECESCQEVNQARSLDVIEIDAASHTGVDNVRENVIATSKIAATKRKNKVFIIDEVHMLSISAFNALLKVLEEPPANVVFILCTTEVHKLPATIISRCQRFDFRRIGVKDIADKLDYMTKQEGIKVDREVLESIARHSAGHMRDAESLLGQIVAISGKEISQKEADLVIPRSDIQEIVGLIEFLAKKDSSSGIALVNKLVNDGVDLNAFVTDLIEVLRKLMISRVNPSLSEKIGLELGESLDAKLNQVSKEMSLDQLVKTLEKFISVKNALKSSFIVQLPVELALVDLAQEGPEIQKTLNRGPEKPLVEKEANKNKEVVQEGQAEQGSSESLSIDVKEVCSRWHEVLAKVKKHNHSLSFILKVCQVKQVEGDTISLAFRHKFHKDRLSEEKIKKLVEETLKEVFNINLSIKPEIEENVDWSKSETKESGGSEEAQENGSENGPDNKNNSDDNHLDNILKTFGGRVVK